MAIENRFITAASILDDSPIDISTPAGLYIPQNYDRDFKGYVSVRTSLGSSLNVPAVRTLVMTGMEAFYNRLKALNLNSLTESADYYGYSLALGSAEVSLLDLTNAYRTLANGGLAGPVSLMPQPARSKQRVLDARATYVINDILSDRAARSITFGLKNELATTFWTAVKTGTSKDMRDNWCIGFSEKYTVGVWIGNFDGKPMWDVSGVTGAAPVWRDVMDFLHKNVGSRSPPVPPGVLAQHIEYQPALEAPRSEWFIAGTESVKIEAIMDAKRLPKIRYPGNGTIIALDPDIPADRQRLFFQAQAPNGLAWQLDGAPLGPATGDFSWQPLAGTHQLALIDAQNKAIDSVSFQVRGSALPVAKKHAKQGAL
jgi:penicillin-binding protein 1C